MKMFRKAVIVLFLLASSGAAFAQTRPFMWVTKSDTATVYLLGSMHAAQKDLYPLDERIETAFSKADALVVEVDETEINTQAQLQFAAKGMYPPGDQLDKHISAKLLEATDARFQKLGLPVPYKQFRPWMVATLLELLTAQRLGFDPLIGIDMHFMGMAKGAKPIIGLETAEQQISIFTSLTDEEQELFLEYTEKDLDNTEKNLSSMVATWKSGDDAKLWELLKASNEDSAKLEGFNKRMLDDRNVAMAAKIEGFLKTDKTYFVVVGAAHLVGDTGLIRLLGKNHKVNNISDAAAVPARR